MAIAYKNGQTSVVHRVFLGDSTVSTGAAKTGLGIASAGLIISSIADNEATATTYTAAGSTIETITTLGTFAAPTASKCRFKEVDATNQPGLYEIQIADARWGVSNAKSIVICVQATGVVLTMEKIPLTVIDPYSISALFTTAMTESYAAAGAAPTPAQAFFLIMQKLYNEAIVSTTGTVKKLDNSTTAATLTYNDATNPTGKFRAT